MEQWELARPTGVCSVTGRELREGEEYFAVLFEDGETFRRADCCLDAWSGPPEGAFCHFKTRVPVREPTRKRLLVDDEMLINLFCRLAEQTEPLRLQFRFVLALILMRKRLLRYEETIRDGEAEHWQMRLAKEQSVHRVLNPHLTDDQIEGVSRQLGAILHGDALEGLDLDDDLGTEPSETPPQAGPQAAEADDPYPSPERAPDA
ncbi:MAG TPA: hypothetical protein VM243_17545 [Phycisphaerae bacterium]|nr:hypothetical protein [Phycisphaerae bacterium]